MFARNASAVATFCSGKRWALCDLFFAARRSRRRFLWLRHGEDTTINLSVASVFGGAGSLYCGVGSVCGGARSSFRGVVSVCGVAGTSFCGAGSRWGGEAGVVLTIKDLSMLDSSLLIFSRTPNNSICKSLHLLQSLSTLCFPAASHASSLFASQFSTAISSSAIFSSLTSVVFHLWSIFFIPLTLSVRASFVPVRWYCFLTAR